MCYVSVCAMCECESKSVLSVCVCVFNRASLGHKKEGFCVCVRQRERETERERGSWVKIPHVIVTALSSPLSTAKRHLEWILCEQTPRNMITFS